MKAYYLSFLPLLLLFSGCSKESSETEVQRDPVVFSIETTGDPALFHGQEQISIASKHLSRVAKIALYLNGELVAEDQTAPFEVLLETDQYADGNYQLKVVAHTADGKESTEALEVTLSNILFKLSVPNHLPDITGDIEYHVWAYLSDPSGKLIGEPKQVQNNNEYTWKRPKGFTAPVTLNRFSTFQRSSGRHSYYIYTVRNIKTGLLSFTENVTSGAEETSLRLVNQSEKEFYYDAFLSKSVKLLMPLGPYSTETLNISLSKEQEKVLLCYYDPSKYGWIDGFRYQLLDVKKGSTHEVDVQQAKAITDKKFVTFPRGTETTGVGTVWKLGETYCNVAATQMEVILPADEGLSVAAINISGRNATNTFSVFAPYADLPEVVAVPKHKTDIKLNSPQAYTHTTSGTCDMLIDLWTSSSSAQIYYYYRNTIDPSENTPISAPVLPDVLVERYNAEKIWPVEFKNINSVDYAKLDGYAAYVDYLHQAPGLMFSPSPILSSASLDQLGGYTIQTSYRDQAGGRHAAPVSPFASKLPKKESFLEEFNALR